MTESTEEDAASGAVLIYPPLMDPTSAYHPLKVLDDHARHTGLAPAVIIDANIEGFHWTLRDDVAVELRSRAKMLQAAVLDGHSHLPAEQQVALARMFLPDVEDVRAAVGVLQDPVHFYDYPRYRRAVALVSGWMSLVFATSAYPGCVTDGFNLDLSGVVNLGDLDAVGDPSFLDGIVMPYRDYIDRSLIPRIASCNLVGINLTYEYQMPFALAFARVIRAALPEVVLAVGGTQLSDLFKYSREAGALARVLGCFDYAVVGEGESAWVELRAAVADQRPAAHPNIENLTSLSGREARIYEPAQAFINGWTAATRATDSNGYLSPSTFTYFSPTRGCYWNKCTFCDYGLNQDSPTSPWRHASTDAILDYLEQVQHQSRYIYLSVDVLAPAQMLQIAEGIIERGIDVCWGAEIRLEKFWSLDKCHTLRRSGLQLVSVGFESANDRVLGQINKGTRIASVDATLHNLHAAGICVQIMGFTGFPGETPEEAEQTFAYLEANPELWSLAGVGEFVLTAGSIVAKKPLEFGITTINYASGTLQKVGTFTLREKDTTITVAQGHAWDARRRALHVGELDRPWLGGIDTPHTTFYADRYGLEFKQLLNQTPRWCAEDGLQLVGSRVQLDTSVADRLNVAADVWIREDGRAFAFPAAVLDFLSEAQSHGFDSALAAVSWDASTRQGVLDRLTAQQILAPAWPQ